jgi:dynein heavy chain
LDFWYFILLILGFSFPQAFLTAALQNHARKSGVAIDLLSFEFKIDDKLKPSDIKQKPEIGLYVYGMFLEGAKWNYDTHILDDSSPKELYTDVPMIQFVPVKNRIAPKSNFYNCPLYKVLSRAGTLSTTGHSTNYVLFVEIPSDREQNVWVKAGVAMFLALKQ